MTPQVNRTSPAGLLLSDDLIFSSRITAEGRGVDLTVLWIRSTAALIDQARQHQVNGIIIDLAFPGLDLDHLLTALRSACATMPRVIAYGPHVEAEALRAARAAGCDPVLPRSRFVEALSTELVQWLSSTTP